MQPRHPTIARSTDSVLVLIDCQVKLWKVISDVSDLEGWLMALVNGARLMEVPIVITEQNPSGLGSTIPKLKKITKSATVIEKSTFSCWGEPTFVDQVHELDRGTLVLCGVETHVCVLQTALDLLAAGYQVHVVADATGTRMPHNLEPGLRRAAEAGAVLTSVESVLFEWLERCDVPVFKDVLELLK